MYKLIPVFLLLLPTLVFSQQNEFVSEAFLTSNLPHLKSASMHKLDVDHLITSTSKQKPITLKLSLPYHGAQKIQLEESTPLTNDFLVTTEDKTGESLIDYAPLRYYQGSVAGSKDSGVAISSDRKTLAGTINYKDQLYNLGLYPNSNHHIIYDQEDHTEIFPFSCTMIQSEVIPNTENNKSKSHCTKAIRIYIECDYQMYHNFGQNITSLVNHVTTVFNQVQKTYKSENIPILLSQVKVWTDEDPYENNSAGLLDFKDQMHTYGFNGDLAMLLTNDPGDNSGKAYVNQLCSDQPLAYCDLKKSSNNYPVYTWDAQIIAHEIGHIIGSNQAHVCEWQPYNKQNITGILNGGNKDCLIVEEDCPLHTIDQIDFKLAPNPNTGSFKLLFDKKLGASNYDLKIMNALGELVHSNYLKVGTPSDELVIEDLNLLPGMYYIVFKHKNSNSIQSMIVR